MKGLFVISGLCAACFWAGAALADEPATDFTFRRVTVPASGHSGPRINVQIAPGTSFTLPEPEESTAAVPTETGADPYAWYWAQISPALSESGPGRLEEAVTQLVNAPPDAPVPAPRLQDLQDIAAQFGSEILGATIGTSVSPALVLAVIGVESSGRVDAVSSAGAAGLMQLMPATAERFGVEDRTIAAQNIAGGVAFLDWLMQEFDRDPVMVLASYNAGETAVRNNDGVPPFRETREYVPRVLAAWTVARGLCITPPELISDGCVFSSQRIASDD